MKDNWYDWRNQKSLLNAWKQLRRVIQHDVKVLNIKIKRLRADMAFTIIEPELPLHLQTKIDEYNDARSERKSLSRIINILNRNIRGAKIYDQTEI